MKNANNTNVILAVLVVVLVGIFAATAISERHQTPGEKFKNSVNEVVEEIGDEIDDNTTSR